MNDDNLYYNVKNLYDNNPLTYDEILKTEKKISQIPLTEEDQKEFINNINNYIEKNQKEIYEHSKLENFTIKEFMNKLYNVIYNIIEDISKLKINYINDENELQHWWKPYVLFIENILQIFFKSERIFYVGIIIFLITICLYILDLSK